MKKVSFSRVVSGADSVATAFDSCGGTRLWWRAILWLHGKPTSPIISDSERRHILADGFRFYAQLYRFVAALFWLVGGTAYSVGVFETSREALYWTLASAIVGGFLWFATSLGFAGAKALRQDKHDARSLVCAFMVAIIAFLSGLTASLCVIVQWQTQSNPTLNLLALAALWTVGIASYLIEVLYLVSERSLHTPLSESQKSI